MCRGTTGWGTDTSMVMPSLLSISEPRLKWSFGGPIGVLSEIASTCRGLVEDWQRFKTRQCSGDPTSPTRRAHEIRLRTGTCHESFTHPHDTYDRAVISGDRSSQPEERTASPGGEIGWSNMRLGIADGNSHQLCIGQCDASETVKLRYRIQGAREYTRGVKWHGFVHVACRNGRNRDITRAHHGLE